MKKLTKVLLGVAGIAGGYGIYSICKDLNTAVADNCSDNNEMKQVTTPEIHKHDNDPDINRIKELRVEFTGKFKEAEDYQFIQHLEFAIKNKCSILIQGPLTMRGTLYDWVIDYIKAYKQAYKGYDYFDCKISDEDVISVICVEKSNHTECSDLVINLSYPDFDDEDDRYVVWTTPQFEDKILDSLKSFKYIDDPYFKQHIRTAVEHGNKILVVGDSSHKIKITKEIAEYAEELLQCPVCVHDIPRVYSGEADLSNGESVFEIYWSTNNEYSKASITNEDLQEYDMVIYVESQELSVLKWMETLDPEENLYNSLVGLGYRLTVDDVQSQLKKISKLLQGGYTLRIVGGSGADRCALSSVLRISISDLTGYSKIINTASAVMLDDFLSLDEDAVVLQICIHQGYKTLSIVTAESKEN